MRRAGPLVCVVVAVAAGFLAPGRAAGQEGDQGSLEPGRLLYLEGCASCHGAGGEGVALDGRQRGPSLRQSGEAAAYYYLATGRMPLHDSEAQPRRKTPAYDPAEIDELVAYVASLGDGPPLPTVDLSAADLANGGVLFRSNCQACHAASGSGGALSYGSAAPNLHPAEPLEIGAALRSGPGQMPVFGPDVLSDQEVDDVVRYVRYLRDPADPGGLPIGRTGPIPEGFVAWLIGMVALLTIVSWIGTHAPAREVGER